MPLSNVPRIWFKAFIESQYLTRGGSRHWRTKQRVPQTGSRNLLFQRSPIPEIGRSNTPKIILQLALLCRTPDPSLIRTVLLSHLATRFNSRVVDRLKYLDVQLLSRWRVKGHTQCHEGVRESLHADPDGTVAEVGTAGLRDRIVVHVDDSVEIEGNHLCHVVELGEIVLPVGDERRECYGGEIANRNLVGG